MSNDAQALADQLLSPAHQRATALRLVQHCVRFLSGGRNSGRAALQCGPVCTVELAGPEELASDKVGAAHAALTDVVCDCAADLLRHVTAQIARLAETRAADLKTTPWEPYDAAGYAGACAAADELVRFASAVKRIGGAL